MSENAVTWLGHSTVVIELDGVRLLTDPVLRRRVSHLVRVGPAPATPAAPDAVLISHGHLDHLDLPSLARFPRETLVAVPRGLGSVVARRGFRNVTELGVGDEVDVGGVTVRATPADHGGGKPLPGRSRNTIGFAVAGSSSVFFAGDTDLFDEMEGLVPQLDLALVPIWGWGPTIGPGHLDPERAARALALLAPKVGVPIHFGTLRPVYYSTRAAFLHDPLDVFVAAAEREAPGVDVRVLEPGDSTELPR
jgi:L-ascorbate metabolism protein UlaG (beta-lactamase superfamily)